LRPISMPNLTSMASALRTTGAASSTISASIPRVTCTGCTVTIDDTPTLVTQLTSFDLIWEREGVEIARQCVSALDAGDARAAAMWLSAKHNVELFDESVHCRVEKVIA
jgi:hypothetical protein